MEQNNNNQELFKLKEHLAFLEENYTRVMNNFQVLLEDSKKNKEENIRLKKEITAKNKKITEFAIMVKNLKEDLNKKDNLLKVKDNAILVGSKHLTWALETKKQYEEELNYYRQNDKKKRKLDEISLEITRQINRKIDAAQGLMMLSSNEKLLIKNIIN